MVAMAFAAGVGSTIVLQHTQLAIGEHAAVEINSISTIDGDDLGIRLNAANGIKPSSKPVDVLVHCTRHSPTMKKTVCGMDHALVGLATTWHNYTLFESTMGPYWDPAFTYIPMYGIDRSIGLRDWFIKEMETWSDAFPVVEFNQVIFLASGPNATSTTYAVGDWMRELGPLKPTGTRMTVRITDFYVGSSDGRIKTNWMMIDLLDLLRQQGIVPLPLSPLPQGRISPPQGDAIPAPLAHYATASDAARARGIVTAMLEAESVSGSDPCRL